MVTIRSARFWRVAIGLSLVLSVASVLFGATTAMARITLFAPAPIVRERMHRGDWRLEIARDRFSGALACQLRSRDGRAIYRSGAVGFRFYRPGRVTDAVYRIDGGDTRAARDDLPRLIMLGAPIDHGSMTDPTDGVVWVPYDQFAQARTIAIEPQRGGHVRVFRFGGLVALHDIAVTRGCAPESRFVDK